MVEITEGCVLSRLPASTRLILQGRQPALQAACGALGVEIVPEMLCTAEGAGGHVLRVGPFELALQPTGDGLAPLEAALAALPHSLVDVSDRNVSYTLQGWQAADILAALCPLDFSLAAFPVGMATRSILDKAGALIWRTADQTFHIEVWRSFAPYVEGQLHEVAKSISYNILTVQH
ncbi:sarcosine oxidase subunit gamma (plasmid) [Acetobacter orientalis]|uniref:sarcosine oxidase subunit gamma n=1 Tax=Acetobacter orientalis TaxID=146474 RepID=UPI003870901B